MASEFEPPSRPLFIGIFEIANGPASAAFLQDVQPIGRNGQHLLDADIERIVPGLSDTLELLAEQDQPSTEGERQAFLRGALQVARLVKFIENADDFETAYALSPVPHPIEDARSSDDDVDAAPQPAAVPDGGRSTDVLFLAPPDL